MKITISLVPNWFLPTKCYNSLKPKPMNKTQPRIEMIFQELFRQTLHCAVALFIIPLRWLGYEYAVLFSVIAFFWNLLLMPRFFPASFRPEEKSKGYSHGMLIYPGTILILALLFPLPVLASAWAVLSIADALATLTGKLVGKKTLAWNRNKTWLGFFSFFISAWLFGYLGFLWTKSNVLNSSPVWLFAISLNQIAEIPSRTIFLFSALSALVASWVESLPLAKLDDNLTAPLAFAITLSGLIILFL